MTGSSGHRGGLGRYGKTVGLGGRLTRTQGKRDTGSPRLAGVTEPVPPFEESISKSTLADHTSHWDRKNDRGPMDGN